MKKLKIGVIGLGYWGQNVVRNILLNHNAELKFLCDSNQLVLESILKKFHFISNIEQSTNQLDIIQSSNLDAIYISTPSSSHFDIVKACLENSINVLCEKPLCLDGKQARELYAIAKEKALHLMSGYTFLFNKNILALKQLLHSNGSSTNISYFSARRSHNGPIRKDVNVIWDLAPHDVSILNYLTDSKPIMASASGIKLLGTEHEDIAFITLFYPKSIVANIHLSWVDSHKTRLLEVITKERNVLFNDLNKERPLLITKKEGPEAPIDLQFRELSKISKKDHLLDYDIGHEEPLGNMINSFINLVLYQKENIVTPEFDINVIDSIDMIMKSIDSSVKIRPSD